MDSIEVNRNIYPNRLPAVSLAGTLALIPLTIDEVLQR